ncbi:MAG: MBL fold metallo-hydrolase [Deltaproteobacteria bacterium]|nr:MBL fold metallo-hydrolase [Deltaproteobacteria bacterium]MBW2415906.1 MBL fold metallo-hydrolase [Deltaproteobacteria bacterium]
MAGELGPAPRGEDGRFENPAGPLVQAGPLVTLPFFMRRAGGAFRSDRDAPGVVANDGAFLRENARHSRPTVTWIGHATLLVQMGHVSFLTDPTWSSTASPVPFAGPRRFVEPGLALEDLPAIDFVLISHNHYDHLDLGTLRRLAERSSDTVFYVPLENGALLRGAGVENVRELDWGQSVRHGAVQVHCLPSQHWSRRGIFDGQRALWASWAVVADDRRFYFAGDTGYFDGFADIGGELGPFDLAALPIGAYEPVAMMRFSHLDPEEAVRAGVDLRARRQLAIHFGTFDLSDEPLAEPPRRFRGAGRAAGIATEDIWVLRIGETREF